ncbi:hypothetical protein [Rathayibacter soli]|uniref:hypothetical protein n=1 Tax=Rathayibacter soli TaxID=3144168 RepID=UPI0027E469B1|nr:hypothetical protein [Glaciibacter superstes]
MSTDLPAALAGTLLGVLIVSSAVWLGGWVALVVVARSTTATLSRHDRVAFFRHFGPRFGIVATIALVLAYISGIILLAAVPWSVVSTLLVVVAVVILIVLGVGVLQARRMSRLRRAVVAAPEDTALATRVRRGGQRALALRAGLGVLSLAMVVLAVILVA